jgi:signal transduction histidine kinase
MTGWLVALALAVMVVRLRRRLELVARAEHELRGPLTAFALQAPELEAELARARTALDDLTAARTGRRIASRPRSVDVERLLRSSAAAWGARLEWCGGETRVVAEEGRLAQAVGNLLANAAEHGDGQVTVAARRAGGGLHVEVVNPERGRGLKIAAAAARHSGGRLALERGDGEFRATLELPAAP